MAKYIVFSVYRRSYLIWSPVIVYTRLPGMYIILYGDGDADYNTTSAQQTARTAGVERWRVMPDSFFGQVSETE